MYFFKDTKPNVCIKESTTCFQVSIACVYHNHKLK